MVTEANKYEYDPSKGPQAHHEDDDESGPLKLDHRQHCLIWCPGIDIACDLFSSRESAHNLFHCIFRREYKVL